MTDKIKCRNCDNLILTSTAKRNDGLCQPCVNKLAQQAWQKETEAKLQIIDPYHGITDPIEIIKIKLDISKRKYDRFIRYQPYGGDFAQLYRSLTQAQVDQLIQWIDQNMNLDMFNSVALPLSVYSSQDVSKLITDMIQADEFYPAIIFRSANQQQVKQIVQLLAERVAEQSESTLSINHLLCALAWTNTEATLAFFQQLQDSPPDWQQQLYVPASSYTLEAGWLVDKQDDRAGRRKQLYFDHCYPLLAAEPASTETKLTTNLFWQQSTQLCQCCQAPLVDLLTLDLTDSRLTFLPITGPRLTLTACLNCHSFNEPIYMAILADGTSQWSELNEIKPQTNYGWLTKTDKKLVLAPQPRPAYFAADQFLPTTFSQIGGMPTWIQDSDYPNCPKCYSNMMFIGQVDCSDLNSGEGLFYAFLCCDCRLSTFKYQTT